ncbi:MAG: hypothetical protein FWD31_15585 [Planctomycetaceae bacterium]|nr:hypothetical protein [Planctomycetaceae bacterium]
MAKIPKREPERQQVSPDQVENENASPVDETPVTPEIREGTAKPCEHKWVFSMSVPMKDEPDKRLVYYRCDKCNELKTAVEDCHV